jgi:hypothetical protein
MMHTRMCSSRLRRWPRTVAACSLVLLVFATQVAATVIVPADLGELTRDAYAIAVGRVVATEAQWTPGRRSIETIVTLAADDYLKGNLGAIVDFRVPGGVLGRYRNVIMGAPTFAVGQRVVVFLGARGPSMPFIVGLSQGVFRIVARSDGATLVMPTPILPGAAGPLVRGTSDRAPAPLAAFASQVRALAGGAR